jgi:RNA polymerase sigma factor (sigma-70 family)
MLTSQRPGGDPEGTGEQDAVLVTCVAGSDTAALRELYERHAAWLHARLMRRCNDPDVVVDVVQDTFVTLWKDAKKFRGDGDVAAWLWGIAFRRMVSRLRSRKDVVLLPDWEGPGLGRALGRTPAAEEEVLLGVEYGDLADALRRLSPEFRSVVQAVVLDGLTTKEAGRLLGVRENTVKTRLHRAKGQLRGSLAGAGIEKGWR